MTLSIDDELYRLASEAAAFRGKTLDEFIGEAVRRAVAVFGGVGLTSRNGLPVMVVPKETPVIDPAKVRRCLEEEGF